MKLTKQDRTALALKGEKIKLMSCQTIRKYYVYEVSLTELIDNDFDVATIAAERVNDGSMIPDDEVVDNIETEIKDGDEVKFNEWKDKFGEN